MNITLSPELENLINEKIKSGRFNSPGEVVREGLRLLNEQDRIKEWRLEELRREIMKGKEEMESGQYTVYNSGEEIAEEIIRRGNEKLAQKNKENIDGKR